MRLEKIQIYNRAPFNNLILHIDEKNISVLSGLNGVGKTTIISYIVDAFYEFAKKGFAIEFQNQQLSNQYYRISSGLSILDNTKPSFVYLRFNNDGKNIDYIDIRNPNNEESYNNALQIPNHIPYSIITTEIGSGSSLKYFTTLTNDEIVNLFKSSLLTYFPAYRYEQPGYLNDPFNISLNFRKTLSFTGYLTNPIEITSGIPEIANWIMDIVLDTELYQGSAKKTLTHLNHFFNALLGAKLKVPVRLGIGPRHQGGSRISIVRQSDKHELYPSIFNMSSGELVLTSLFCELTRQADNLISTPDKIDGIVLVDEIDKHLHIKIQKEILPKLIKLFPNVQFIVTSHSPFLNLGLADEADSLYTIFDLDNNGTSCTPHFNDLFKEVYDMIVNENEQFAQKYQTVLAEIKQAKKPLIITEGKTDWKHLKAAMTSLNLTELNIDFYEYDYTMGDVSLMKLLEQFAITAPNRKIIGVFDRDNDAICAQIHESGKSYKQLSKNIYAISIPTVNADVYGPYTSIEHYYPKVQLLKETAEGRRLFLGEEFFEGGMSKDQKYFTRFKGIQNKVKVNGVIDEKVFLWQEDPEFKNSIALPKDDFAQLIYDQDDYATGFDFSEFTKIFDVIREVISLP